VLEAKYPHTRRLGIPQFECSRRINEVFTDSCLSIKRAIR
jgi:hypothetical protein